MTDLRHERRSSGCEIYQRSVTAERKHTDQIHHGTAAVSVLLRFFRCVSTPLNPRVCAIVTQRRGDCQFRFSCVFLTENLLAMNYKRSNMSYMGGAAAPSFSSVPYSAIQTPLKLPLKMGKLPGGKAQICYARCPCFLNNFFLHSRNTYAARPRCFRQNQRF